MSTNLQFDEAALRTIVEDVMRLTTTAKVIRHLNDRLHELAPNLELLEIE